MYPLKIRLLTLPPVASKVRVYWHRLPGTIATLLRPMCAVVVVFFARMSSGFEGEEISESQPALPQHHLLSIGFLVGERTLVCASGVRSRV